MAFIKKRGFSIVVIFTMLLNSVFPLVHVSQADEADAISVEEAIANNNGTATVTGYIIGTVRNGPTYQNEPPFSVKTNLALADSPDEANPSNILPVQLPKGDIRDSFNLADHPEYLKEKVFITGSLEDYFGVEGLKSPTAMWLEGSEPPGDGDEPPEEGAIVTISEIQGDGHTSPYKDQHVQQVEGVVTFVQDDRNFFIQSQTPDNHPLTSEGILIYKGDKHDVSVGDLVKVDGTVKEWVVTGSKVGIDLPVTEINATDITVIQSNVELPEPVELNPPTEIIDNDSFTEFDPAEDAIDYYESLEGMLVSVEDSTVVGPQKYGEFPVLTKKADGKPYTDEGGILLTAETANPEKIFIDVFNDDFTVKVGDRFNGTITGVLSYDYSNFMIYTDENDLPELIEEEYTRPVTALVGDRDSLTIASYNIENYHHGLTEKTEKIAESIVTNLQSPDIIGLVEVQDNDGPETSGVTKADKNYEALIAAIETAGGPAYHWTDIAPEYNEDGGQPGGNIRVGFLYNPERVQLTEGRKGTATEAVDFVNGSLTLNPGRIDPTNDAFSDSRKPLAAQFTFNGEDIIVINNHFNSKGGDEPLFGVNQPPTLHSEHQRIQIAEIVNGFVEDILSEDPGANVVVMGDLNDFPFSEAINRLQGDDLVNLINRVPLKDRYTYIYEGNSQVLDHILVSHNLAEHAQADIVNLNAAYMEEHGRASDHDPVLAQLNFEEDVSSPPADEWELTIMHTNDSHARVEQFPYLGTAVDHIRANHSNNLLLHAGDVFSGSLYFTVFEGMADLEFMNEIGYDAMVFGNHEFDRDSQVLGRFVNGADFPFVSANIDFSSDPILGSLVHSDVGRPGEGGNIYPAIVKQLDGESVGILGLTTEDTPTIANPGEHIQFHDAVEKAKETVKRLERIGINKIIALSHMGDDADLELAKAVNGIDVVIGGHSHTELPEGAFVEKEEPTVIVQAGENLEHLGALDVTFDETGVITDYEAELLHLENYEADPALQAKVDEYYAGIEGLLQKVVGETTVALDGKREHVRSKETNLGNLITDSMVWKMKQFIPETSIALQNGGGIRASIDAGEITMGDIREVLPFNNTLVAMTLTGEEIWRILEQSVSSYPETSGGFLHVSGLRFTYDPEKPIGKRVWSVEVKTEDDEFVPIDKDAVYTVATNSFIAKGGDGFETLKQAYEDGRMTNIDVPDYEAFSEYLQTFSPISPKVEGRIVAAADEKPDNGTQEPGHDQTDIPDDGKEHASGSPDERNRLPDTSTDLGKAFLIGIGLVGIGLAFVWYSRVRKRFI